jgi:hypothetical protein
VAVVISATAGADTSARIIDRPQIGVIATLDPNRKIKSGVSSADAPDFIFGTCRKALRRKRAYGTKRKGRWFCKWMNPTKAEAGAPRSQDWQ